MNPEIKKKWVDALRSGKYKQGTGALRRGDSFCVLGVVCDLFSKEYGTPWETRNGGSFYFLSKGCSLPAAVLKWMELPKWSNENIQIGARQTLSSLNDTGFTFAQLADAIEEQL